MALRRVSSSFLNHAIRSPRTCHRIVPFSTKNETSIKPIDQIVEPYVKSLEAEGLTPQQARALITTCTKFMRDSLDASKSEMNSSVIDPLRTEFNTPNTFSSRMQSEKLSADLKYNLSVESRLILDEEAKRIAKSVENIKRLQDEVRGLSIKIMETKTEMVKYMITLFGMSCGLFFAIVLWDNQHYYSYKIDSSKSMQ
ncbi:hypothetical protein ACFE04_014243 [Oxalis oulophora]